MRITCFVSGLLLGVASTVAAQSSAAGDAPPQRYTIEQAARGGEWFAAACESCHPTRDMSSADFQMKWNGRTALDLYRLISTQMPEPEPGSLSRRTYADIVAYLMRLNGVPAGPLPLTADSTVLGAARLIFGTHTPAK